MEARDITACQARVTRLVREIESVIYIHTGKALYFEEWWQELKKQEGIGKEK